MSFSLSPRPSSSPAAEHNAAAYSFAGTQFRNGFTVSAIDNAGYKFYRFNSIVFHLYTLRFKFNDRYTVINLFCALAAFNTHKLDFVYASEHLNRYQRR